MSWVKNLFGTETRADENAFIDTADEVDLTLPSYDATTTVTRRYGNCMIPFLFRYPPNGREILKLERVVKILSETILTCSLQITAVIPLAKNMPAMVTMKG